MNEPRQDGTFEGRSRPVREDPGRLGTIVFGLVVIAVGLWFFAERTLGLALPRIDWGALWPLILIAIGAWVLLGAGRRRG
jgi:hypothetical protein